MGRSKNFSLHRGRDPVAARKRLTAQIVSCWRTQALHTAVRLDLPDRLAHGSRDVAHLATACDCSPDGLQRLLRALCALGVLHERVEGRFGLTPTGDLLRRAPPDNLPSLRGLVLWWGHSLWRDWSDLTYSVKTGRSARAKRTGRETYGFPFGQTDVAASFHEAMQGFTALVCDDVGRLSIWGDVRELVDVGGGTGELACALAARHPALRAIVFDRADAHRQAIALFDRRGVADRVQYVAGDFFASIPAGADCYVLKSILHNWSDNDCGRILSRCAEASTQGTRLTIVERLRPARMRASPHDEAVARADLNMLIGLEGRERALSEFACMLKMNGFALVDVLPTRHDFSVIVAERR